MVFDETKRYDPDHPFAKEIVREGISKYIDNVDIPNIKEADPDAIFNLVDDEIRLQRSTVTTFLSRRVGGNTLASEPVRIEQAQAPATEADLP